MSSRVDLKELIEALAGAVIDAQDRIEQHQIAKLGQYFDEDNRPRTVVMRLPSMQPDAEPGTEDLYRAPLLGLVPANALKIKDVEMRFDVDLGALSDDALPGARPTATGSDWQGSAGAAQTFSSWARLLAPQPFVARHSGAATFHLAATDDGRIDAAEQIAVCEHSGRRVLRSELVRCSVTAKNVLPDFTESCPVTGEPTLRQEFAPCSICRQRVSKAALAEGVCAACRSMKKASKDDPRLVWIFGEHPGLDKWNRWQLAETAAVYIAQAGSLMTRLLVVVDKETLAVRRLATAGRLGSSWVDAHEQAHSELLRG